MKKRMLALIGVVVLQLLVASWLVVRYEWRLSTGTPVVLQTIPMDTRDLLRGDYVSLDYVVTLPDGLDEALKKDCRKRDAWLVLSRSEEAVSEFIRLEFSQPSLAEGEAALKVRENCGDLAFDEKIHRYYIPEGSGLDWEQSGRKGPLSVVLATTPEGQATISALRLDADAIYDGRLF